MDYNQELVKSLTSLIDETLEEIEVIKKSKFAASEITIEGPGDTKIGDKPTNGSLDAKKKEEKEDEDEEDKDEAKKGENEKADPDHGKFAQAPSVSKGENEKADPDHGKFAQSSTVSKKEDEDKDEDEDKKKKEDMKEMKKSISASQDLMKSYVDEKFSTLEERLSKMTSAIESLANAPVGRRGVPAGVQALAKSADETESLTKSKVVDSLMSLKKSGTYVDSSDIFTAETCKSFGELKTIADKYGVK
jgi:flagellar biosynthesis GTPase FlhF